MQQTLYKYMHLYEHLRGALLGNADYIVITKTNLLTLSSQSTTEGLVLYMGH